MPWYEIWLQSIVDFEPITNQEKNAQHIILEEAEKRRNIFDRYADPRHCTASAIIIGPRGIILHRHKKLQKWIQPGGHIDNGESPWDCVIREAKEETGLTVIHPSNGPLLFNLSCHDAFDHYHLDIRYLLLGQDTEPTPPPGESQEVEWFQFEDALKIADDVIPDVILRITQSGLANYLTQFDSDGQR